MRPEAIVLIGLPATGKSTYIKKLLTGEKEYVIISNDEVTKEWGEKEGLTYNEAFKRFAWEDISAEVQRRTRDAVGQGKNIIFDNTHMDKRSRDRTLQAVPEIYRKIALIFEISEEERQKRAVKRFREDGKFVPKASIDKMKYRYEPPRIADFDDIEYAKG